MIPVKQDKHFMIEVCEISPEGLIRSTTDNVVFQANGNAELTAKAGNIVREFSEQFIPEWRKSL